MNHTLLSTLPHISEIYNYSRYLDRIYRSTSKAEVYSVITTGIEKGFIDPYKLYTDADHRLEDYKIADWVMSFVEERWLERVANINKNVHPEGVN